MLFPPTVLVLCFDFNVASAVNFLTEAYKHDMVNDEYVYIVPMFGVKKISSWMPWADMPANDTEMMPLTKVIFQHVIVVCNNYRRRSNYVNS